MARWYTLGFVFGFPFLVCLCGKTVGAPSITVTTCTGDHAGNHADHPAPGSGIDVGADMNLLTPRGVDTYVTNPVHHAGIQGTGEGSLTWEGSFDAEGKQVSTIDGYRADGTGAKYYGGVVNDWFDYCGEWWSEWGS